MNKKGFIQFFTPIGIIIILLVIGLIMFNVKDGKLAITSEKSVHPIISEREAYIQSIEDELIAREYGNKLSFFAAGFNSLFYDDYLIEDDFTMDRLRSDYTGSYNNFQVNEERGWLSMSLPESTNGEFGDVPCGGNQHCNSGNLKYNKNLKNRDVQIKAQLNSYNTQGVGINIRFGNQEIYTKDISSAKAGFVSIDILIDLIKDITDENKFVVIVNGVAIKEITINEEDAYLEISASANTGAHGYGGKDRVIFEYIKSRAYFSCEVDNNEVVVV